ncbi:MAG: hypothetical protein K0U47_07625 [Epsilonproteobacteria bacterium]|nr:hypothetical protein [Campylobacterota bacterium]
MSNTNLSLYYAYDIETFPNVFTCVIENIATSELRSFEISTRQNDAQKLYKTLQWLGRSDKTLVGYNNLYFDYPVIQYFIATLPKNLQGEALANELYHYASDLIRGNKSERNTPHTMVEIKQLDLFRLHHFDNKAKRVSLKMLEVNMRSQNIEDLPFTPGTTLKPSQIDTLLHYNRHDVRETVKFFHHSKAEIAFRQELSERYNEEMMNYSDMKIGKRYFIRNLEERLGDEICFKDGKPRQTPRNYLNFSDIILPCVEFQTPPFQALKNYLQKQYTDDVKTLFANIPKEKLGALADYMTLSQKGVAASLHVNFHGFRFDLGTGGLHGSVESCHYERDEEYTIIDVDVASYYPSIVVQNSLYPEHLGEEFSQIYSEIRDLRFSYPKGSAENKMLKLSLNAAGFGDTNNQFSPFYDPKMTITITTNGQLMLCMLAEMLAVDIPNLSLIQANTDGLTMRLPRADQEKFYALLKVWESKTGMELEKTEYTHMWIRDVNNYIAKDTQGNVKKIGAYKYDLEWYQNHSALVVPKAVEAFLIEGVPLEEFIKNHTDAFDFMLSFRAPRGSSLVLEKVEGLEKSYEPLQTTLRYYIAKEGKALKKVMPSLKQYSDDRIIGINVGYMIQPCSDASKFSFDNVNFEWYIKEAEKLTTVLFGVKQKGLFD